MTSARGIEINSKAGEGVLGFRYRQAFDADDIGIHLVRGVGRFGTGEPVPRAWLPAAMTDMSPQLEETL